MSGELKIVEGAGLPAAVGALTREQIELVKRTVAKGTTDDELALFLYVGEKRGLDPLTRDIHAVKRFDKAAGREVMSIQTGIDGYRKIAARTGAYAGNDEPTYGPTDDKGFPEWATVAVWRIVGGQRCAFTATARWKEYYPGDGGQGFMWRKMPFGMLAKCAEALALRKAFPEALSGIYTHAEMDAGGDEGSAEVIEETPTSTKPAQIEAKPPQSMNGDASLAESFWYHIVDQCHGDESLAADVLKQHSSFEGRQGMTFARDWQHLGKSEKWTQATIRKFNEGNDGMIPFDAPNGDGGPDA